jgi:hypothetical protein
MEMLDGKPAVQMFQDELNELVAKYCDNELTLAEAIGVLDMAKMEIFINNSNTENGEDDE